MARKMVGLILTIVIAASISLLRTPQPGAASEEWGNAVRQDRPAAFATAKNGVRIYLPFVSNGQSREQVYPQGTLFPLGLYSVDSAPEMEAVKSCGWNMVHTYNYTPSYLEEVTKANMLSLASLPGRSAPVPPEGKRILQESASSSRVTWWDLPEELRYWESPEMNLLTEYAALTRQYDLQRRPNYMYIPGNYEQLDVEQYIPYLDIIPASIYTTFMNQPHAWARWRMETTVKAIKAKATLGSDYLAGQKIPVAVLELFYLDESNKGLPVMTPEGAYHGFWQAIVSGAKGILVYSYFHRQDRPELASSWNALCEAASQVSGPERLGQVILNGTEWKPIGFQITSGPTTTVAFVPTENSAALNYPSIDLWAKSWNNNLYVIVVNSAEKPVSAMITGLPTTATQATVLFNNKTLQINNGTMKVDLMGFGVQILKIW